MNLKKLLLQMERMQWKKRNIPPLKGPILTREVVQSMPLPKNGFITRTSGSTGVPVEVRRTILSKLWYDATTLREVIWHKRKLTESFAVIRPNVTHEVFEPSWGPAFALIGQTGPVYAHPVEGDLNTWLQKVQPGYLYTLPSILETIDLSKLEKLKGIKTTGETVRKKYPSLVDSYSSEEFGTIAIQCPDNPDVYHVMENIIVEILDEKDKPTTQGRVIITDLSSEYLYRYDIGDYAELGECHCGRGLQTIKRILGRKRNMVTLPDGSRHWPRIGSRSFREIAKVRRFQGVQVSATTVELRLIVDEVLTKDQEQKIRNLVQKSLGYPFDIQLRYVDEFPPGKFEEFVNKYDAERHVCKK